MTLPKKKDELQKLKDMAAERRAAGMWQPPAPVLPGAGDEKAPADNQNDAAPQRGGAAPGGGL